MLSSGIIFQKGSF